MSPSARSVYFATCAPGLEPVLHAEARGLRLGRVERQVGGVLFEGPPRDAWRANLELATAIRVLRRLERFEAHDEAQLYRRVHELPWEQFLVPEGTLWVQAHSKESALDHTHFIEQRVKDAIVDRFRERTGARPSVEREAPDLPVHVHLFRDRVTLSLDTSGESLHRRGWRLHQGRAPLAETLAAGLVLSSEWDRRAPLLDPFCGSGTVVIEAACLAAGLAPGHRRRFAFERWPGHEAAPFERLRAERSRPAALGKRPQLVARDLDPQRVEETRENAAAAGVGDWIRCEVGDVRELDLRRGWNAWIVSNAPYGRRIGGGEDPEATLALYRDLGALLRERAQGCTLGLLAGGHAQAKALGLRGMRRVVLVNGGLECVLVLGPV